VENWTDAGLLENGLTDEESDLLEKLPLREGRLLLLGVGGGREAIPLAQAGFDVTGVDFIPEMVTRAQKNAEARGLRLSGLVQDFSKLDVPGNSYDIIWLSAALYSSIPTRERRVAMLRRVRCALKPEGFFVCQFHWNKSSGSSPRIERFRKVFAWLTLGNRRYQRGDMLCGGMEFIHAFSSKNDLRAEFEEGGFDVFYTNINDEPMNGGALLKSKGN
jgi:ubiquinone/menaquinone biosynthesis C-methylase UbiE